MVPLAQLPLAPKVAVISRSFGRWSRWCASSTQRWLLKWTMSVVWDKLMQCCHWHGKIIMKKIFKKRPWQKRGWAILRGNCMAILKFEHGKPRHWMFWKIFFLVNFHGNFQAKPNFVHGKTWQLILQTKIYFIFFLIWRIFLLIFLKQGREYKKNREISWLLTILWLKIPTWQRCPDFRRLTWQLKIFWWQPWPHVRQLLKLYSHKFNEFNVMKLRLL